ncbi:uncharacterized protein LOC141714603 [Apium graveolens]|uniref:uncharacterized protein LOC141714603 n=1 Tax=Apium graveolens TaxID=4045 RepID=UPI003D798D91
MSNKESAQLDKNLEVFKQVKVNIPFLDAIQQVPTYAKCLKDLCTHKRTTYVPKKVVLTFHVSSILSNQIPVKYKDPGCPTISCIIGNTFIDKALLDLGASVNLPPLSFYQALGLGELKKTSVTLQLADRSVKIPKGIVEDVLIKIGDFIFPVDFVVLETEPFKNLKNQIHIIIERPFIATSNALINCRNEVNLIDEVVSWSNLEDIEIESLIKEDVSCEYESNRELHELYKNFTCDEMLEELNAICSNHETQLEDNCFDPKTIVKTSVGEPPILDPILSFFTLNQSLVVDNETHDILISSSKVHNQEFQVINLLKQQKEAPNWSMNDVSAMSFILMHDLISLVDNVVLISEFHMCVDCVTKVVFPHSGIG